MGRDQFQGVSEQAKAGKHRMEDAQVLIAQGRWRGAKYLAGYSVECLLKVKLMKQFGCGRISELEEELKDRGRIDTEATMLIHNLEVLVRLTGAMDRLKQDSSGWSAFNLVNRWIPAWRYSPDLGNQADAEDFVKAVGRVNHWIEHNV